MITEDYVSFEIAKLLKEKGFSCDEISCIKVFKGHTYKVQGTVIDADEDVTIPTIQLAMKWLREKYALEIYPYHNNSIVYNSKWWFEIVKYPNSVAEYESGIDGEFNTYEDACEDAIK